jgi:glucokinase
MVNRPTPEAILHPNHGSSHLIATQGLVIGAEVSSSGTRLAAAAANLDGTMIARVRKRLPGLPDAQAALAAMHDLIERVAGDERVRGNRLIRCAVAVGAPLDSKRGVVRTMYRAEGWNNLPLQDLVEERWQVPVIADNDANAAALGEARFGAGRGGPHLVYLSLGRGIGSGIVLNGQIYHGATGLAGEIGHTVVKEDGPRCSCGGYGHLEAIASAQAIVRTMIGLAADRPESLQAMYEVTGHRAEAIRVDQIFRLAEQGDPVARHVTGEAIKYLALAIANLCNVLNPATIVIGGTVAAVGDRFFSLLREQLVSYLSLHGDDCARIVPAELGEDATVIGAIALALQDM